jgi:hypothetical protein
MTASHLALVRSKGCPAVCRSILLAANARWPTVRRFEACFPSAIGASAPSMVRKVIEYRGVSTARNAVSHIRRASPAKVDPVEREEGSLLRHHVGAKIGRSWSNELSTGPQEARE